MRDLVETVIGQVMKQQPTMAAAKKSATSREMAPARHALKAVTDKDPEMWKACCQFEAMFLQQMMAAMRKTVPESEFLPRGYADNMYEGMMDQAIAESGSKHAPLGLATSIYRQMQQQGSTAADIQAFAQSADSLNTAIPAQSHGWNQQRDGG